jgi:hypothetical protein
MFKISKDKLVKIFNSIFPATTGQILSYDGNSWLAATPGTLENTAIQPNSFSTTILVDPNGKGSYTTVAAAMTAIADSGPTKKYRILVLGKTTESAPIPCKDFVIIEDFGLSNIEKLSRTVTFKLSTGAGMFVFGLPLLPSAGPLNSETLYNMINTQNGAGSCTQVDSYIMGSWETYFGIPEIGTYDFLPGNAVMITLTKACSLALTGYEISQAISVSLGAGITLVSFPNIKKQYTAESLLRILNSLGGTCTAISRYDTELEEQVSHILGSSQNDFDIVYTGGYFITSTNSFTFKMTDI